MSTISPALYAPSVRSTGVGWAIGIGRVGAIGVGIVVLVACIAVAAMRPSAQDTPVAEDAETELTQPA
jgi:hypothetical protein